MARVSGGTIVLFGIVVAAAIIGAPRFAPMEAVSYLNRRGNAVFELHVLDWRRNIDHVLLRYTPVNADYAWLPDGSGVAVYVDPPDPDEDPVLWKVNWFGRYEVALFEPSIPFPMRFDFSPDGSQIAYIAGIPADNIRLRNLANGEERVLPLGVNPTSSPVWGEAGIFYTLPGSQIAAELFRLDPVTGDSMRVAVGLRGFSLTSGTGVIVYARTVSADALNTSLALLPLPDGTPENLPIDTRQPGAQQALMLLPVLMPDGRHLVYVGTNDLQSVMLYHVDLERGQVRMVREMAGGLPTAMLGIPR
ncbi:MAG: hypothetical protein AAF125_10125 [Chloroflexota bacterium]